MVHYRGVSLRTLGAKSPLYGRRTAQIHLDPFEYLDAARMLPGIPAVERVEYYAAFGGTPYYLAQLDAGKGLAGNVADLMFRKAGLLYEEPMMLLRQEVREPALYGSVLRAVATGAGEPAKIASAAGVEANSVGKYLRILEGLGLVERTLPFGESRLRSRRVLYVVADPFFAFWYRFVAGAVGAVEMGAGEAAARRVCDGQALPAYVGRQFERVALQWVARANRAGRLPFLATELGRWWGNDPGAREQVDVDLVAANRDEGAALFGECKWRNDFDGTKALETLERRSQLVAPLRSVRDRTYLLVTKREPPGGTGCKLHNRATSFWPQRMTSTVSSRSKRLQSDNESLRLRVRTLNELLETAGTYPEALFPDCG